jgi:hypothetical protein
MDSYMASNGTCFMVTWIILKNHLLEVGLTQNRGDHGTPNAQNRWFILYYHVWGPACIKIHWEGPVTYDFTPHSRVRDHTTWCWRCVGTTAFGHFLLGSQNFIVTALGSCVKWPLVGPEGTFELGLPRTRRSFGMRVKLRATSHTSQEPWPTNYESPKESVQRPSQDTSKIMYCGRGPSSLVWSHMRLGP